MISKILVSSVNEALHNFELVLTGRLKTMPYFHFKESFQQLLSEIRQYNNLTEANIDIIANYYSMMGGVEYNYEKWDVENYESHPDYNVINSMYCELWNVCYNELLHFLKTYANDRLIDVDSDDPLSITGELKDIDAMVSHPQPIQSSKDLRDVLNDIFEHEIRNFIGNEGFYKLVNKQCDEDFIQKALKLQLENALLKRHIEGVDIYRESQNYDDKRPDFLIKYGFIGPVMLEIKLLHNTEITDSAKRKAYKEKIQNNYLYGTHSEFGFYLVFRVSSEKGRERDFQLLQTEYSDIEKLTIKLFDCAKHQ